MEKIKNINPARSICVMNAGAALYIDGRATTIAEGCHLVEQSLESGEIKKNISKIINP